MNLIPTLIKKIALVGKYTALKDSYLSVYKSLIHAALAVGADLELTWIEATNLEPEMETTNKEKYDEEWTLLRSVDGIVVPGGFGTRGVDGKIITVNYARTNKVPILGICLGFQVMVIEYARSVLGMTDATSEEPAKEKATKEENANDMDEDNLYSKEKKAKGTPHVIVEMPEIDPKILGGTMRCGARPCLLTDTIQTSSGTQKSMSPTLYKHKFTYPNVVSRKVRSKDSSHQKGKSSSPPGFTSPQRLRPGTKPGPKLPLPATQKRMQSSPPAAAPPLDKPKSS